MGINRFEGDVHVTGSVYATGAVYPSTGNVDADRLQHAYAPPCDFGIESDVVPTNKTVQLFVASSTGTVRSVKAALTTAGSDTDVDFDVLKNGVSILNTTINVLDTTGDGNFVAGTIDTTSFSADDIFTADLAVTNSTGALGPVLRATFEEESLA